MIYKEWPNAVRLKQDGRYWFVVRRIRWRNREVDDVLEVSVDRQRLATELLGRGYREADSVAESVWLKNDAREPGKCLGLPEHLKPRTSRQTKRRRSSDGSNIVVRSM